MVLGVPHPKHLPLTAEEFVEWEAFSTIEPWGFEMENVRFARLSAVVANFSGNTRKVWKPVDFLPPKPGQDSVAEKVKRFFGFGKRSS
jgi:hypothetical protein